ncbi:MAG: hypothetical protein JWR39_313 [Devosia sp.]|nr:hypothetical protein [Devosia sp.]
MNTALIKPAWSPLTIALMVLGFIIFWPLGLAVLGYILWGEKFGGSPEKAHAYWSKARSFVSSNTGRGFGPKGFASSSSGNAAFDEYRSEQLRRLEEERRRLDEEIEAFREHMANLHKAKDREEFDRFMNERGGNRQGYGDNNTANWGS